MNRPKKVKYIYQEFRSKLSEIFSDRELLILAAKLVDINDKGNSKKRADNYSERTPSRRVFEETPLDELLTDGGWKILNREFLWPSDFDFDFERGIRAGMLNIDFNLEIMQ
jgi:hypothetical protein